MKNARRSNILVRDGLGLASLAYTYQKVVVVSKLLPDKISSHWIQISLEPSVELFAFCVRVSELTFKQKTAWIR